MTSSQTMCTCQNSPKLTPFSCKKKNENCKEIKQDQKISSNTKFVKSSMNSNLSLELSPFQELTIFVTITIQFRTSWQLFD